LRAGTKQNPATKQSEKWVLTENLGHGTWHSKENRQRRKSIPNWELAQVWKPKQHKKKISAHEPEESLPGKKNEAGTKLVSTKKNEKLWAANTEELSNNTKSCAGRTPAAKRNHDRKRERNTVRGIWRKHDRQQWKSKHEKEIQSWSRLSSARRKMKA
jgi:hypothetical protein